MIKKREDKERKDGLNWFEEVGISRKSSWVKVFTSLRDSEGHVAVNLGKDIPDRGACENLGLELGRC